MHPIRAQTQIQDLRREVYDLKLQRTIDDVHATTVNRTQMISGIAWTCVEWVAAIATAPFPVLSLSIGLALAFKDAMLALHAYHQGDNAQALEHLMGYLLNSAGGLFTDLRPALGAFQQFAVRQAPRRLVQSPTLQLIGAVEPAPLKPAGMRNGAVQWRISLGSSSSETDRTLFALSPRPGHRQAASPTTRLAAPDTHGVWRRTGVTGGAPKYQKSRRPPMRSSAADAPQYADKLEQVLNPDLTAQLRRQGDWVYQNPHVTVAAASRELQPVRDVYQRQVSQLTRDAEDFRQQPPVAPRAEVPTRNAGDIVGHAHR